MRGDEAASLQSEAEFAALVEVLAADPARCGQLTDLLREDHPVYRGRGAAAVIRMRGWVLLAIARAGVSEAALIFLLEELDAGVDPYLVAAAARALRSYPRPTEALAPFVMRALNNIRYRDEPVSFAVYGDYAVSAEATSAVHELLATLSWFGPLAQGVLPELLTLQSRAGGGSRKLRLAVERTVHAITTAARAPQPAMHACCCDGSSDGPAGITFWPLASRRGTELIEVVVLEDQEGELITFKNFFKGHPTVVIFFYTRCDNPMKCSLTVAKLARVQGLLDARGFGDRINTAAITYDPAFDRPDRLRIYARDRGVRMDARHRMLRSIDGNVALCRHFELGVNFVASLVNRHRIELFILDAEARIAVCFERIHWDEREVVDRAIEVLNEQTCSDSRLLREGALEPEATKPKSC
jgi:protein SCO1/2